MRNIFIIGSKGIPSNYGGFETFVDKLTEYSMNNSEIRYHVACKNTKSIIYHNCDCFGVKVPNIGPAQAIYYDIKAFNKCFKYIKDNKIERPIVYVLACRIGICFKYYSKRIHKMNGFIFVNPDGHEWKRAKWNRIVKKYWKYSEKQMIKYCDLAICDSENIEKYISIEYANYKPNTAYISYGAEISSAKGSYDEWLKEKKLKKNDYYLVVGRFVPENNYETIIREFMKSNTKKDLAIVTNANEKLMQYLINELDYQSDRRIKFVGTVYEKDTLKYIRENAFGYIHGHEVGGTNPSLLEALASTKLNLLFDVSFNREVGGESSLYWNKELNSLSKLINTIDDMTESEREMYSIKAKSIINDKYNWKNITDTYIRIFNSYGEN